MLANISGFRVVISNLVVAQVVAATAGETAVAVTGCNPGDVGVFAGRQANATGIVFNGARCAAAGTMLLRFCNPSAGNLTPPATDDYDLYVLRGTGDSVAV